MVRVSFFVDTASWKPQGAHVIGVKEALNRALNRALIQRPENTRYGATRLRQDIPPT